jgi:DNA-binding transcriptional ArsR family regulator
MPLSDRTLEDLAQTKEMDPGELQSQLREMEANGLVYLRKERKKILYGLPDTCCFLLTPYESFYLEV